MTLTGSTVRGAGSSSACDRDIPMMSVEGELDLASSGLLGTKLTSL